MPGWRPEPLESAGGLGRRSSDYASGAAAAVGSHAALPAVDIVGGFAVVGAAKLPPAQVNRLHDAFVAAFASSDVERYARLAKKADIKLD